MTPELKLKIDAIVSFEHRLNLVELHHMATDQLDGYPGFKRQHRYFSRWRDESAICLTNFVIDHYGYMPSVSVNFNTPSPIGYDAGINAIMTEYEALRLHYAGLSRMAQAEMLDELMQFAESKLMWVAKCRMKYYRDLKESSGKSVDYIQLRSAAAHEKYRAKEKAFSIDY